MREQHHHVDLLAAAEGFDGGAAGVARGRHHDGGALSPRVQHMVHQPRHQLHRQVLEGERGPVEQFEHEQAGAELHQRRGGRMAEGAVGLLRHAREIGLRDAVADEGPDHLDRDLGIGPAGKAGDRHGTKRRPGFRHVQAAVAGQPGEHDLDEIEHRGFAPR